MKKILIALLTLIFARKQSLSEKNVNGGKLGLGILMHLLLAATKPGVLTLYITYTTIIWMLFLLSVMSYDWHTPLHLEQTNGNIAKNRN